MRHILAGLPFRPIAARRHRNIEFPAELGHRNVRLSEFASHMCSATIRMAAVTTIRMAGGEELKAA